jgi:hypothetical protein
MQLWGVFGQGAIRSNKIKRGMWQANDEGMGSE